ncbi:hypothetical protein LSTR_LSTR015665 [Laodelphax striatellus]|uniref:Uncharacterized protein n=1 Tax=Laodelphax striatellus TaxID=195883 RepID=A0A482XN42_LAOST|nr:hypothetical protein LSTR_LSTR015665 [Laodelphax striatellus]
MLILIEFCSSSKEKRAHRYRAAANQKSNDSKQPHRDPYELNLNGKENPCVGVLCPPKSYVDPPNQMSKNHKLQTLDGRAVCQDENPEPEIVWSDYGPVSIKLANFVCKL